MTFPTDLDRLPFRLDLERLLREATEGPWVVKDGNITTKPRHSRWGPSLYESGVVHTLIAVQPGNAQLIAYLVNHAPAILELVRAAEQMTRAVDYTSGVSLNFASDELKQALAKLNGAAE